MNTILQKRIEEAAEKYSKKFETWNVDDDTSFPRREGFEEGATFALQNQWISVEEALPEEGDMVFVTGGHHRTLTAIYYKETGFVSSGIVLSSTHWMPIPQLKGGEK